MDISTQGMIGLLLLGLFAGFLSSLVGIGGGIVIVPALILGWGLSQHQAQGTTLALLAFPVSLAAAMAYHKKGMVDWRIAILLGLGFVLGGYLGGRIVTGMSPVLLRKIFAVIMILIAVKFLFFDKTATTR